MSSRRRPNRTASPTGAAWTAFVERTAMSPPAPTVTPRLAKKSLRRSSARLTPFCEVSYKAFSLTFPKTALAEPFDKYPVKILATDIARGKPAQPVWRSRSAVCVPKLASARGQTAMRPREPLAAAWLVADLHAASSSVRWRSRLRHQHHAGKQTACTTDPTSVTLANSPLHNQQRAQQSLKLGI